MSDLFQPIASDRLIDWVFLELESRNSIFGIPRRHLFMPSTDDPFRTVAFGHLLETPIGPAAGPHTQMAQNIVAAWLCGARYIELKTVQTLDELDVSKPCIDMEDEGYNVEWSQELRISQSFEEYLRAWVLIHALHHRLGFPGPTPGVVFNLSVGYDLDGIRKPNMQWFLDRMENCAERKQELVEQVARYLPAVRDLEIPGRLSDNVTLSTMHGCPPDEIGSICRYLMQERGLHTFVKLNPTLLGADRVRGILHDELGFRDAVVPDAAFGHDLAYEDALPLLGVLRTVAGECGLQFGVKLTNTLEVENFRTVFDPSEKTMYLSGRPLHAITVNLAARLADAFAGELPMSFSAGADCFNTPALLATGMNTVTTCSDLLKTGGYLRLLQYLENTRKAFDAAGASSMEEYILKSVETVTAGGDLLAAARANLQGYAARVCNERLLKKDSFHTSRSKTGRKLGLFDCIEAPCVDRCPVDQKVPQYMQAVREGDYDKAVRLARADNPLPTLLGRVCDHLCEPACIRTHLDEPLAIRHVKRNLMEHEKRLKRREPAPPLGLKVAIIGAGPGGMAAAWELARSGCRVEIFEAHPYAGGMVGGAIPEYRMPAGVIDQDLAMLESLRVKIHYNMTAGRDFHLSQLRRGGFQRVIVTVGAQLSKKLGLEGEDSDGILDALHFLRRAREGDAPEIGRRIGIVGAGDTAMDCARTAWRLTADRPGSRVSVIYRRTIDQMPADREEIACLLEEGIEVIELARPQRLVVKDGSLRGLVCRRMEYRGDRDASGRKIPHDVPDTDFELSLDNLILAISQHAILDFFGDEPVALNSHGYIEADPRTLETSIAGVYAGGDVVNDGPSSIVEAAADGKRIARSILQRNGTSATPPATTAFDAADLLRRRSHRRWRIPVARSPLPKRRDFSEVVQGYTDDQARAEAERCLDCHRYCSICAGVCPNLAIHTIPFEPFAVRIPEPRYVGKRVTIDSASEFRVNQAFQVAVLADFCNECGNCTTFCPTAGRPYRDKPRLYLDRGEFEAQRDNAFMFFRNGASGPDGAWAMEARWDGTTHRIDWREKLDYRVPSFHARLDPESFEVEHIQAATGLAENVELSLKPCAVMFTLLRGLKESMPHLTAAGSEA